MQVKKFEAPTLQEALENVKRELGPEAIILQTRNHRKGFGLLSKTSVEVTAAASERSMLKKEFAQNRLYGKSKDQVSKMSASDQTKVYDEFLEKHLESRLGSAKDQVSIGREVAKKAKQDSTLASTYSTRGQLASPNSEPSSVTVTARRYADINDGEKNKGPERKETVRNVDSQSSQAKADTTRLEAQLEAAKVDLAKGTNATNGAVEKMSQKFGDEMLQMRKVIEQLQAQKERESQKRELGNGTLDSTALSDQFEELIIGGVDRSLALELMKKAKFELDERSRQNREDVQDAVAGEMLAKVKVGNVFDGLQQKRAAAGLPISWVMIGPTGVGKTTTVAKLASIAKLQKKLKVGLINLDTYKVGAFEQLASYGKLLNVPFRSVASQEDLRAALAELKDLDLIIFDTSGRSHKDAEAISATQNWTNEIPNSENFLVLSATTRDTELVESVKRFSVLAPKGLVFSKLDESSVFGSLYNTSLKSRVPMVFFTTGQRVPEDIEEASSERLVSLILEI